MSKQVVVGVGGGIAAYKIPHLIRLLRKLKYAVHPVMTANATRFVTPFTVETLAGNPCPEMFSTGTPHLTLAKNCSCFVVAPATADLIAKMAHGIADDLLTTLYLSMTCPVLIVPAMHDGMIAHPAVQANLEALKSRGHFILGPDQGELSFGDSGWGRMVEPELIAEAIEAVELNIPDLKHRRLLICAGGTREPIDSVRLLSNRSSGRMGQVLANQAALHGATVTLITTQTRPALPGVHVMPVETAAEMKAALEVEMKSKPDVLIMPAAVSDYQVENPDKKKVKKSAKRVLDLIETPDILKSISGKNLLKIGFCLEDDDLIENAKKKIIQKNLDFVVANHSSAIGATLRTAVIIDKRGEIRFNLESAPVDRIAGAILSLVKKESGNNND